MGLYPFLFLLGALVMRLGLAIGNVGAVRSRHAASAMGRQLLDLAIATLATWAASFALISNHVRDTGTLMPLLAAPVIAGAMHIGATSERSRKWPMLGLSLLLAGVSLPLITWVARRWLVLWGFVDAGYGYAHLTGATTAAVAVVMVGARDGKYNRDGSTSAMAGHNLPLMLIGALIAAIGGMLIAGMVTALLAAAASMLVCALYCQWTFSKIDLPMLAASLIGGVVAVSPGAGLLPEWALVLVGAIAGLLVTIAIVRIDMMIRLDDVTGAVATHGVSAALGLLAAAQLWTGTASDRLRSLAIQALSLVIIVAIAAIVAGAGLMLLGRLSALRAKEADEFDGLDIAEHETAAYPDFQQNSIR